MKKQLLLIVTTLAVTAVVNAQPQLAPDQNPDYAVSRDKYMKMADSLNSWHSTTLQETYVAIDWMADKEKARTNRRQFLQQMRLERARWSGYDHRYNNRYNNYNDYSYDYNYNNYPGYRNNRWQRSRFWWW